MSLCSSQCQRAGTGQVGAGVRGEGVRAYAFITCLPHRPPDPSHLTPPASFFPPWVSPSSLCTEESCGYGGPGDTLHDSCCHSLLSITLTD